MCVCGGGGMYVSVVCIGMCGVWVCRVYMFIVYCVCECALIPVWCVYMCVAHVVCVCAVCVYVRIYCMLCVCICVLCVFLCGGTGSGQGKKESPLLVPPSRMTCESLGCYWKLQSALLP